ncbi:hypothetical protein O181_008568 [Austropuccinia psidii MF-1]|uniref:Uncharacterized protein n=1 Tax=Austropuccinia psidii MF-1 TaxID=1389203 RepID=A0A9Q3BPN7_9BASI|nr:hypothetical protein [Austropuccinia psidii MF-1]
MVAHGLSARGPLTRRIHIANEPQLDDFQPKARLRDFVSSPYVREESKLVLVFGRLEFSTGSSFEQGELSRLEAVAYRSKLWTSSLDANFAKHNQFTSHPLSMSHEPAIELDGGALSFITAPISRYIDKRFCGDRDIAPSLIRVEPHLTSPRDGRLNKILVAQS